MKKLVVLSGSGISAESGIPTFRDMGGTWEHYDVSQVATPEAWSRNPGFVLEFYNQRRKKLLEVTPNAGHFILADLERVFDVQIITQNVDDLHERAGSSHVLHLHGELKKARSTIQPGYICEINGWQLNMGDLCPHGSQLRPHIVWFGEVVDQIEAARELVEKADFFLVVGTSLNVYPAAGLLQYVPHGAPIFVVDPSKPSLSLSRRVTYIAEKASTGMEKLRGFLVG